MTTTDRRFSLVTVNCMGCLARWGRSWPLTKSITATRQAPSLTIFLTIILKPLAATHGTIALNKRFGNTAPLTSKHRSKRHNPVFMGGTGCRANASQRVYEALAAEIAKSPGGKNLLLKRTGCLGFCEKGPILIVFPSETCYVNVKPSDAAEIVAQAIAGDAVERLLWRHGEKTAKRRGDIPFYKYQSRRLLADSARIDPLSIEDYIDCGGYAALARVLGSMTPEAVVAEIKKSGLRGRGGGGFSTGAKWEAARRGADAVKYVVVNGDEGDPGAYMDRSLLEGAPHSVLEGLIIGAFAVGAHEGYFYIRQEYPLALENVRAAIARAQALGLLGKNILGSGFDCTVTIHQAPAPSFPANPAPFSRQLKAGSASRASNIFACRKADYGETDRPQ